jgi:hypothetical protein
MEATFFDEAVAELLLLLLRSSDLDSDSVTAVSPHSRITARLSL